MTSNHQDPHRSRLILTALEKGRERFNNDPEKRRKRLDQFCSMLRSVGKGRAIPEPQRMLSHALGIPSGWNEYTVPTGRVKSRMKSVPNYYSLDIAHPPTKTCIEVDGPLHQYEERKRLDDKKDQALELLGWKVIRVTNQEVMTDLESVVKIVRQVIGERCASLELVSLLQAS
jgi:hypothetical protein